MQSAVTSRRLRSTICGLKRNILWVPLIVALVVVIAIAGGVGGSPVSKKASKDGIESSSSCEPHCYFLPFPSTATKGFSSPIELTTLSILVTPCDGYGPIRMLTATFFSGLGGQSLNTTNKLGVVTISGTGLTNSTGAAPVTGSNFAAVNWDTNFMVFYQANAKNIRMVESNLTIESGILKYKWSRSKLLPFTARSPSPIAAISWLGTRNRREV